MSTREKDIIIGIRPVIEAIRAGKDIDKVLIKRGLRGDLYMELLNLLKSEGLNYQYVPVERINRISKKNNQGIIAYISPVTFGNIEQIIPMVFEKGKTPLILILDGITDVRNFGAIARTAECAGADAIIIGDKGSVRISSDAIKASAGALHNIPVCKSKNMTDTLLFLRNSGLKIIAASERSEEIYYNTILDIPVAIILGSEDRGVSSECLRSADTKIRIPVLGSIGSLNVSVAAAVILYEAIRQRNISAE